MMIEKIFTHQNQKVKCEVYCIKKIYVKDAVILRDLPNIYAEWLGSFTLLLSLFFMEDIPL